MKVENRPPVLPQERKQPESKPSFINRATVKKVAAVGLGLLVGTLGVAYMTGAFNNPRTSLHYLSEHPWEKQELAEALAPYCETAIKNHCIPIGDGSTVQCLGDLGARPDGIPFYQNDREIICGAVLPNKNMDEWVVWKHTPGKFLQNFERVCTYLPKQFPFHDLLAPHYKWASGQFGRICFKTHLFRDPSN